MAITHNKISGVSDGADTDVVRPSDWNAGHVIAKVASDNLRNSHDAEVSTTSLTYELMKTMTINEKLLGTVRIKFDLKVNTSTVGTGYGKIYHNGVALGIEQTDTTGSYVPKSEDITHNFAVGDTLEIWGHYAAPAFGASVRNFRLYYDNGDIVTVSTTNS